MRGQLRCYKGEDPEDTYETVRLEGARASRDGEPARDVHLYELYWADLSRLKAGLFSIFTELYQVLFHLSSVGTHTIDAAAMHHRSPAWKRYRRAQSWASVMLTVPIPLINLFMLAVASVALGLAGLKHAPVPAQTATVGAVLATTFVASLGLWLWKRESPAAVWSFPVALWIAITAGATAWGYAHPELKHHEMLNVLESVFLAAAAGGLIALLIRAYNRRRPGASQWAVWLASLLLAMGAVHLFLRLGSHRGTLVFWVGEFEALSMALTVCWAMFFVLGIAAWGLGVRAVREVNKGPERDVAARSCWTAQLLLSLPSFVFVTVTLAIWGLIAFAALKILPPVEYSPLLRKESRMLDDFIRKILSGPVEQALPVVLLLAAIAILPAIWSLGPVAWREVFPPEPYEALHGPGSVRLGRWLTRAFAGLKISGRVLYAAMMFVMPLAVAFCGVVYVLQSSALPLPQWMDILFKVVGSRWVSALGVFSGAAFAWLFAMRGSLRKLALGFRPVLNIILDIDNWLREHPLDANPKARICGRYVSLLRYVCNWRHPITGQRYDKIVILAHSQGTVVSADLLRFIHAEAAGPMGAYDPQLARLDEIPVYFFTMGCPLRQMYGLRFPYLYEWARHEVQSPMESWSSGDLPADRHPHPTQLGAAMGLALWVNAYRSGDYIGRNLWRTDGCEYLWNGDVAASHVTPSPYNSTDGGVRLEFCIGAGAHTHYWDRTAPMIARELDRLIGL
jgi:hypothetical protein